MGGTALRIVPDDRFPDDRPDRLAAWAQFMIAIGNSQATVKIRTQTLKGLLRRNGIDHMDDLTRDHVIEKLSTLTSQWTRVTYWRACRAYDAWRVEFGELDDLVLTKGLKPPTKPEPIARPIDDDTINRLLALNLTKRPRAYVRIALFQALRVHEIAKIRAEDVDVDGGWLRVLGKGRSHRRIPLHPEVAAIAGEMPEVGYWFPVYNAEHVSADGVGQTIKAALKLAGSNATAHQLRDTAATRIQRQHRDIRVTQDFLRHSSVVSTQKYAGVSDSDLQEAVKGLSWGGSQKQVAEGPSPEGIARALLAALGVDPAKL